MVIDFGINIFSESEINEVVGKFKDETQSIPFI